MNFVCVVFELCDKMLTLSSMENLIVPCNLKVVCHGRGVKVGGQGSGLERGSMSGGQGRAMSQSRGSWGLGQGSIPIHSIPCFTQCLLQGSTSVLYVYTI